MDFMEIFNLFADYILNIPALVITEYFLLTHQLIN